MECPAKKFISVAQISSRTFAKKKISYIWNICSSLCVHMEEIRCFWVHLRAFHHKFPRPFISITWGNIAKCSRTFQLSTITFSFAIMQNKVLDLTKDILDFPVDDLRCLGRSEPCSGRLIRSIVENFHKIRPSIFYMCVFNISLWHTAPSSLFAPEILWGYRT